MTFGTTTVIINNLLLIINPKIKVLENNSILAALKIINENVLNMFV